MCCFIRTNIHSSVGGFFYPVMSNSENLDDDNSYVSDDDNDAQHQSSIPKEYEYYEQV